MPIGIADDPSASRPVVHDRTFENCNRRFAPPTTLRHSMPPPRRTYERPKPQAGCSGPHSRSSRAFGGLWASSASAVSRGECLMNRTRMHLDVVRSRSGALNEGFELGLNGVTRVLVNRINEDSRLIHLVWVTIPLPSEVFRCMLRPSPPRSSARSSGYGLCAFLEANLRMRCSFPLH